MKQIVQRVPIYSPAVFTIINYITNIMITYYIITIDKPTLIHYYYYSLYFSDFISFCLMCFFCSRISSRIVFNCRVSQAPLGCDNFSDFVFDDFYSLRRTGQVYCRVPLSWSLCDFFFFPSWLRWVMVFWEKDQRDKVPFSSLYVHNYYHDFSLLILTLITWSR